MRLRHFPLDGEYTLMVLMHTIAEHDRIAQWDAGSRKYYFVQISTGESVWEIPTQDAPLVPSPGVTPAQPQGPYSRPGDESQAQTGDRGLGVSGVPVRVQLC